MYLYVAFFLEDALERKKYFLRGNNFESIKRAFPNFMELNDAVVEGCIGYIRGKNFADQNCFLLDVKKLIINDIELIFDFEIEKELSITNGTINNSLYRLAHRKDWVDAETGYMPLVCLMKKTDFDAVRKVTPNIRKISNNTAKIEEMRGNNNWQGIVQLYEPLEKAHENSELWDNADDLYDLAFACSKLGEPRNGQEKDRQHLEEVKRYRNLSIKFYKRCFALKPDEFRFSSALAYRYYLNVMELTKPKGRRDGTLNEEIGSALKWFDQTLELNPKSIKDHYRKGKLVVDKQIDRFKYSSNEWDIERFDELKKMESEGTNSLKEAIKLYEQIGDGSQNKNKYRNEYIKALYSLGSFYAEKPNLHWNEYVCYRISGQTAEIVFHTGELQYIADARDLLEKCFTAESDISLDDELDIPVLTKTTNEWAVSPMDKLYRLGLVYLNMYYVKKVFDDDQERMEQYRKKAEKYLYAAQRIGQEIRRQGLGRRDDWFISEKIARCHIISNQHSKAIRTIEKANASYIKNTYAIALLLSGSEENKQKARAALEYAAKDRNNKAINMTAVLLAYIYNQQDDPGDLKELTSNKEELFTESSKKLLSILGIKVDSL